MDNMEALVAALQDPETRENALLDLSKKRDMFADLAPILWHSFGVIPALLQEIVSIYPLLSPPSLTNHASNRVCNAWRFCNVWQATLIARPLPQRAHSAVPVPFSQHRQQNTAF